MAKTEAELPSVQGNIEQALSILEPGDHTIVAAGRTDAGVHAVGQVAHCDLVTDWTPFRLSEALNFHLKPSPISIVSCAKVDEDWHARFSAVERKYEFRIVCRAPLTHENGLVWHVKHHLDVKAMQRGANYLLGNHDFTTFRSSICQATSPVKTLDELLVTEIPINNGTNSVYNKSSKLYIIKSGALLERWKGLELELGRQRMYCKHYLQRIELRVVGEPPVWLVLKLCKISHRTVYLNFYCLGLTLVVGFSYSGLSG